MKHTAYKIMNDSGKFSTGGTMPRFTKRGKIWGDLGHVRSHITMFASMSEPERMDNYLQCEIVEIVSGKSAGTVADYIRTKIEKEGTNWTYFSQREVWADWYNKNKKP
jgi:hypothetical protein